MDLTKVEKQRDIISFAAHDLKSREPVKGLFSKEALDYIAKHDISMSDLNIVRKLRNDIPLTGNEVERYRQMQGENIEADVEDYSRGR